MDRTAPVPAPIEQQPSAPCNLLYSNVIYYNGFYSEANKLLHYIQTITFKFHLDDLGPVRDSLQALRVHHAVLLAGHQFVPPAKEEIPRDKLEPRRKRVAYDPSSRHR
jgi:hypothetical protein